MKPYERRAAGAYPYYKLATWDNRNQCWNDGKRACPTIESARAWAHKPGRYRISKIEDCGRTDFDIFEVPNE